MNPYPEFYSMKFPRIEIESKINPIAVDKDIKTQISEPKKIKELNRDTLLIEVKSDNQGKKLRDQENHQTRSRGKRTPITRSKSGNSL